MWAHGIVRLLCREVGSCIGLKITARRAAVHPNRNQSVIGYFRARPKRFQRSARGPVTDESGAVTVINHESLLHTAAALRALSRWLTHCDLLARSRSRGI